MRRKVYSILGIVALSLAILAGASISYLRSALPSYDGERTLRGLGADVEIWRDSVGVPHIWAESEEDLSFAIGYLHAQDRLWQMELFRRVADGRLSEILGEELIETDKFLRTIGLGRAARAGISNLEGEAYSLFEAYAAGVNAWLDDRRGALPPEFIILRHSPEPWLVEHSLMLEKIMAWDLTTLERDLALTRAVRRLGPERAEYLIPEYPEWATMIIESTGPIAELPYPARIPEGAATLLEAVSVTRASNSWVISGEHTISGRPILANDMHLSLTAPSLWYLAALHGGRYDVVGMTLPGAPLPVAGHNRAVAWGLTNAYLDDADLFIERLDPEDPSYYLTPDGRLPLEVIEDTIYVRGRAEPEIISISTTRNGPLLADEGDGDRLAFRWIGHSPSNTLRALLDLNAASNWEEFIAAVELFDNPHQNLVYADTAGRIGYKMGGQVPIRGEGRRPPRLPVPGWTGEWDWTGRLPFTSHPELIDPPEGFIVTANNRQVAGDLGDLISSWWEEPFRAQRIRELLSEGRPFDADAVHLQQLDVRDARAERYLEVAIAAAERAGAESTLGLLRGWDLEARPDSRAAALYYTWEDEFRRQVGRSLYSEAEGRGEDTWFPRDAFTAILEREALPWVEGGGSAEFDSLSIEALLSAESSVSGKSLGEIQVVVAEHALGGVPVIGRLLRLNVGPAPIGGSPTTVNVASPGAEDRWRIGFGASQRHLVDMGDLDGAGGFILPTGQSGIPFSREYRDQFERWRGGGLWLIPLDREVARGRIVHQMTLRAEGG